MSYFILLYFTYRVSKSSENSLRDLIGCLNEPAGKVGFKMRGKCK